MFPHISCMKQDQSTGILICHAVLSTLHYTYSGFSLLYSARQVAVFSRILLQMKLLPLQLNLHS